MGRRAQQPEDGLDFDFTPLRHKRRAVDVTQRKLAELIGANANAVLDWEKGRGEGPTLKQAVRAAIRLGTRIEDLFAVYEGGESRWPRRHRDRD
jgi:DNA-binding XRE family transcriptional regulator